MNQLVTLVLMLIVAQSTAAQQMTLEELFSDFCEESTNWLQGQLAANNEGLSGSLLKEYFSDEVGGSTGADRLSGLTDENQEKACEKIHVYRWKLIEDFTVAKVLLSRKYPELQSEIYKIHQDYVPCAATAKVFYLGEVCNHNGFMRKQN